jgi:hydroxypyruvate isomerase
MQTAILGYAPNISWLFPELPFKKRPGEVASLGFTAIEFGFPSHADLDALRVAREELGLRIVLFNQDVPVWDRANRGYLVDPTRRDEFWYTLDEALQIAGRLSVMKIMLPSGVELVDLPRQEQRDCMLENLQYAAPLADDAGVVLTIEALNPVDNPGIFLTTSREGIEIVKLIDHPNVRFQFDTYHIQMIEGDLVQKFTENSEWIGHIQFADFPGRHEPGTGELDFDHLISAIQKSGYQGYIGLEYIPHASGGAALAWASQSQRASHES